MDDKKSFKYILLLFTKGRKIISFVCFSDNFAPFYIKKCGSSRFTQRGDMAVFKVDGEE